MGKMTEAFQRADKIFDIIVKIGMPLLMAWIYFVSGGVKENREDVIKIESTRYTAGQAAEHREFYMKEFDRLEDQVQRIQHEWETASKKR